MSTPSGPRLNLDLYQLQNTPQGPEATAGISVNVGKDRQLFIDPQLERDNPAQYGPAGEGSLVLAIDPDVVIFNGYVHTASLSLEDDNPHLSLRPLGSEKLAPPQPKAVGRAALLGLAEHDDLRLKRVSESWFSQTRLLHETAISVDGESVPYAAKLILLGGTGFIDIASGLDEGVRSFRLRYDATTSRLNMENIGEDGEYEGGSSDDPSPVLPPDPSGKGGIALELPKRYPAPATENPVPTPLYA